MPGNDRASVFPEGVAVTGPGSRWPESGQLTVAFASQPFA